MGADSNSPFIAASRTSSAATVMDFSNKIPEYVIDHFLADFADIILRPPIKVHHYRYLFFLTFNPQRSPMSKKYSRLTTMENRHIQPKTVMQQQFMLNIRANPVSIAIGPAGVGKTFLAVNEAVNQLSRDSNHKIVMSRSNMPTGRTLGSFPGDIKDKLEPWLKPMIDEAKARLGSNNFDNQYRLGNIQFLPLETIRGTSFDSTDILFDEAQNLTLSEVLAVATRVGHGSRLILMGDPFQSDIRNSGILEFVRIMEKHGVNIPVTRFGTDDIVRSDIVKDIVVAMMKEYGESSSN
jgi:phosphate starvation-inducible PhoH-like protein